MGTSRTSVAGVSAVFVNGVNGDQALRFGEVCTSPVSRAAAGKVCVVPVGAILLDERTGSENLKELSHGLRLAGETCVAMHRRYGVPVNH